MTLEELKSLVRSGENESLEFKETTGQRVDACKTLCAFLNADGGTVVFGVSRKGVLTGQLISDSTRRDLFEVFSKFEPSVDVHAEWIPVDAEHQAIVCRVDSGIRKPYLYEARAYRHSRVRNVQVRIQPEGWLIPKEVPKYKDESILEALHNCIAHQDYRQNGRIVVTEYVDRLTFENRGGFYEGTPADYVNGGHTPTRYRNAQLVSAMREVNMIDESGYGIRRLYEWQAERYFPLPDYDTSSPDSVKVTIYGHVVDAAYSSLLIKRGSDLRLDDICLLDRIQKKLPISDDSVAHLRKAGLVEGRKPHIHISAKIAEITGQKAEYMRKKARPSAHYYQLILDYIGKWPGATRAEINEFIIEEIRGEFSKEEKIRKITNWLTYLRKNGKIRNLGSDHDSHWTLMERVANSTEKSNVDG